MAERQFKFVTLLASFDGYKHVVSVVKDTILDCTNRKQLKLCRENVAWSSSKTIDELDQYSRTIERGYILIPPKKRLKFLKKSRDNPDMSYKDESDEKITFRTYKKNCHSKFDNEQSRKRKNRNQRKYRNKKKNKKARNTKNQL